MRSSTFTLTYAGVLLLSSVALAQTTPYYLTDGDSSTMFIIQGGVLVDTVSTTLRAYPPAIRSTVWLGGRDDTGGVEYTLAGIPTGNTSVGNNAYTQLLDGTSDGQNNNYGIECCGSPDSVIRANPDWSGSSTLFDLPSNTGGSGIAYDTSAGTLFVSLFDGSVLEYSLAGDVLNTFAIPSVGGLAALAYEEVTDTLWALDRGNNELVQFSTSGSLLQSIAVPGFRPDNVWGGEMSLAGDPVPESSTLGAVFAALAALGFGAIRQRQK